VLREAIVAAVIYVALVAALRLVGERALARMSGYDLLVTVALGSILASVPLQTSITIADGLSAVVTLLALQWLIGWLIKRTSWAARAAKGRPTPVLYDGRMLRDSMRTLNVTDAEVRAAARSHGMASLDECLAIVLENDGSWSVIARSTRPDLSALEGLELPPTPPRTARRASKRAEPGSDALF
jgi:uncharacterized membrane protein YcaP (DUF421 family)